jgi:hypothetical protein
VGIVNPFRRRDVDGIFGTYVSPTPIIPLGVDPDAARIVAMFAQDRQHRIDEIIEDLARINKERKEHWDWGTG